MSEPIAKLEGVGRRFVDGAQTKEVLQGIELSVHPKEMVALVGPSGCGKTTLLTVLGALDRDFEGQVELMGASLSSLSEDAATQLRNTSIGFVFQSFHLLDHMSVAQNVMLPLWLAPKPIPEEEATQRVRAALASVGLEGREEESVASMSGGERQRVAIARATINKPRLVLADEPTGNLDRETGQRIFELFEGLRDGSAGEPCAVVIATHDPQLAARADRVVRLKDGRLEADA